MPVHLLSNARMRLAAAVALGFGLFQILVVVLVGIFAAIAVPTAYFSWFGKPRQELALAVLDFAAALPILLLMAGGVLATCRAFKDRTRAFLAAILAGMVLCYAYWTVGFLFFVPADLPEGAQPYPLSVRIKQLILVPWWSAPLQLAPWLGFALAAWLLSRSAHREA